MVKIGNVIRDKVKERGFSNAEFARRINKHIRNVYDIYQRDSIDTELLSKISSVLNFNFFSLYFVPDDKNDSKVEDYHNFNQYSNMEKVKELEDKIQKLEEQITTLNEMIKDKDKIIKLIEKNNSDM